MSGSDTPRSTGEDAALQHGAGAGERDGLVIAVALATWPLFYVERPDQVPMRSPPFSFMLAIVGLVFLVQIVIIK